MVDCDVLNALAKHHQRRWMGEWHESKIRRYLTHLNTHSRPNDCAGNVGRKIEPLCVPDTAKDAAPGCSGECLFLSLRVIPLPRR